MLTQAQIYDAAAFPTDGQYVENVMWEHSQVLFVTLNIPGGSNNDADNWFGKPRTQQQTDEIAHRTTRICAGSMPRLLKRRRTMLRPS